MNITPKAQGTFYPQDKNKILDLFEKFKVPKISNFSKLIIVPHAGYEFSGEILYKTYQYVSKETERIIIIAPAIYNKIYGHVTAQEAEINTPFGNIKTKPYQNTEINNNILETETALGVQMPILKYLLPQATVLPILYGCEDYNNLVKIIESEYNQSRTAIIITTNLSRFVPLRESIKLDNHFIRKISLNDSQDIDIELADGAIGICAAIEYAKCYNLKFINTGHSNSSLINKDTSKVVGYGGWVLSNQ